MRPEGIAAGLATLLIATPALVITVALLSAPQIPPHAAHKRGAAIQAASVNPAVTADPAAGLDPNALVVTPSLLRQLTPAEAKIWNEAMPAKKAPPGEASR